MAAKTLRKSETVIWLPPRSVGERPFATEPHLLAVVHSVEGQRYSRLSLDSLPTVRAATLVIDARDVTLIPVKLPPLSGARLRQAVPNAVEDSLLQDAAGCAFGLGPVMPDGRRLVAVADKGWLDFVAGAIERRGIRVLSAVPAQLALPYEDGVASVACLHDGLAIRTGRFEGLGWGASNEEDFRCEALSAALATVLAPPAMKRPFDPRNPETGTFGRTEPSIDDALDGPSTVIPALAPDEDDDLPDPMPDATPDPSGRPVGLQARRIVAFIEDDSWAGPTELIANRLRLPLQLQPLPLPADTVINMLEGRGGATLARRMADFNWRAWRLPAALALASLLVFLGGLNLHWGKLASERAELRSSLENRFRKTFPQARVVVDPLLQMEREVASMRAGAGQSGPDDFLPLMGRFGQALGTRGNNALTGLEYRDGKLRVSFTPAVVAARSVREQMQRAFKQRGLNLRFETGKEGSATVSLL